MHKGYAFIQFTNPFDARSACLGEDGRLLWGQTLGESKSSFPLVFEWIISKETFYHSHFPLLHFNIG